MSPSLDSGLEISHFRIVAPLGEGGMGEVYRAWDTQLEREVALKVLPPNAVGNEDRLGRFVKEAKSASALAHPNIITIYEIGHQRVVAAGDEQGSTDVHYIAMELVDGLTLKHHIHVERTDLKTLLGYLEQAAQGLARSHEAGVVHRDLKPDDIMVTRDGYAKVLDFGLAKLNLLSDPGDGATSAPTVVDAVTAEGVMMGTVGYMSPEQAQGLPIDHRTDIFSFGCLIYEAATRRRPFVADSSIDTLHQILHDEPPAMEKANPSVPGALRRVVKRCMAKDPERRAQSMKDVALELSDLVDEFDSLSPASVSGMSAARFSAAATKRQKTPRLWLGLVIGAAIVVVAALAWSLRSNGPSTTGRSALEPRAAGGFQAMEIEPATSDGTVSNAALSPNGRYLAHTRSTEGGTGLWIRQIATGSDIQIVPPEDLRVQGVVFAPEGEYLYFVRNDPERLGYRALFRVPTLGGEVRRVAFDVDAGVTFSPDGSQIAFPRGIPQENRSVLVVIGADGSNERELVSVTTPQRFLMARPAWSPDGTAIIAAMQTEDDLLVIRFMAVDLESQALSPFSGDNRFARMSAIAWLPDGTGLIAVARKNLIESTDQIWLIEHPSGELRRVSNDLNSYRGASISEDASTLATVLTETVTQLYVAPVDDPTAVRQLTSGSREAVYDLAAAPDGQVIVQRRRLDQVQLWKMHADGSQPRRLTSDGSAFGQAISEDGTVLVACIYFENDTPHVWRIDPDTGARLEQLTDGKGEMNTALSPNGDWMLYGELGSPGLWKLELASGEATQIVERYRGRPEISPDGLSFAHAAFEEIDGQSGPVLKIISREGQLLQTLPWDLQRFYWHPDGTAIVGVRHRKQVGNLWRVPLDGSEPTQITEFDSGFIVDAAWSPDGEWLYVTRGENTSDAVLISNFR